MTLHNLLDFKYIAQRLEIVFWTLLVRIMKTRRPWVTIPLLFSCSLCLVISLLAVTSFGQTNSIAKNSTPASSSITTPPAPTMMNGQRNILVIGVDKFRGSRTELQSVWLALYIPPTPHVTLLPLYPSSSTSAGENNSLVENFRLDSKGIPDSAFFSALMQKDLWWDRYIIVENEGLEQLAKIANKSRIGAISGNVEDIVNNMPSVSARPQDALVQQAFLLKTLCQTASESPFSANPAKVFDMLSPNMRTDLSPVEIESEWESLHVGEAGLSCEFPTLQQVPQSASPSIEASAK